MLSGVSCSELGPYRGNHSRSIPGHCPPIAAHSMSILPVTRFITLPRRGADDQTITTSRNLLFVGANGSGKTRLGSWLDMSSPDQIRVFRISAQ